MDEALDASRMTGAGWDIARVRLVIDETYGIAGAQAPEIFTDVLERAWSETHPEPDAALADAVTEAPADACTDGACPV